MPLASGPGCPQGHGWHSSCDRLDYPKHLPGHEWQSIECRKWKLVHWQDSSHTLSGSSRRATPRARADRPQRAGLGSI
eukprot:5273362-Lingulodinium_polyedra.AAC.1